MTDYARLIHTEPQRTACEVHTWRPAVYLAVGCLGWALFLFTVLYAPMAVWQVVDTWRNPPWTAVGCALTDEGGWRCPP